MKPLFHGGNTHCQILAGTNYVRSAIRLFSLAPGSAGSVGLIFRFSTSRLSPPRRLLSKSPRLGSQWNLELTRYSPGPSLQRARQFRESRKRLHRPLLSRRSRHSHLPLVPTSDLSLNRSQLPNRSRSKRSNQSLRFRKMKLWLRRNPLSVRNAGLRLRLPPPSVLNAA